MKKQIVISFIALLVLLVGVKCAYCQQDNKRFLRWLKDDPVNMVSNIQGDQVLTMASFGMGIAAMSASDANISGSMRRYYSDSSVLDFTNRWGAWETVVPISAGIFGTSLLTKNTKFQDAAFTSLQSLIMTNLTVNAGKFLFARERPIHNEGPFDMEFAELGATSFPSGHTATAFAFLTPWVIYYPGPITYSLMAIPVGTAIARVAKGRHWLSDVTAGAAIGFSMAYYLSKRHLNIQSERVKIMPVASRNSVALSVNLSF
ncbi:phosphatase PAP2 family protein [Fodinibius sp.]|uniref:phosphatase PAP2 family protein n=1 Tax=Fodinibius sp. TaxID=1872440 RepID=UPI002ACF0108|nr:phosphatase PAP2 family protein [Fodinibius sp.]MDZ7659320.1 phosphatase PAP2 family protein [Fodinibius sp.]